MALLLFLLLTIIPANAANQQAFQGYFNFRQVSATNDQVSLTVDVKLFNRSGADVHDAIISVVDLQPKATYGSFPGLSIANGQVADVSQSISIPIGEFQRWQTGATPRFMISYIDASGVSKRRLVTLVRRSLKGGN